MSFDKTEFGDLNHWTDSLSNTSVYIILANARLIASRNALRGVTWAVASELFACGSTYAHALCRRAGVEPGAKFQTFTKIARSHS